MYSKNKMAPSSSSDDDSILDIIHSLPSINHSVALAKRTPTIQYTQKIKFIPDFGGILETQDSALKNNALNSGLPFKANSSSFQKVSLDRTHDNHENLELSPQSVDCLVISTDHHSTNDEFLVFSAIKNYLYIDLIERRSHNLSQEPISYTSSYLVRKDYDSDILGLKLTEKFLLIKFAEDIKILRLNQSLYCHSRDESFLKETFDPYELVFSVLNKQLDFTNKDSCFNKHNETIVGIASDYSDSGQVKVYDINSKSPIYTVSWNFLESSSCSQVGDNSSLSTSKTLRGRVVRTFVPVRPITRGIQQLEHIPSHLVNMLVTTSNITALVDPRAEQLGQIYVNKNKIPSFYPTELLRRTVMSNRNGYQFYSLSNVHVRIFDTRFPCIPMNQLNHMIDSDDYNSMHSKLINYEEDNLLETLCCSSSDRLCFTTFDQARKGNLVNPRSVHQPWHDSDVTSEQLIKNEKCDRLFGLDVEVLKRSQQDGNSCLFSVIQLCSSKNLCIRDYFPSELDCDEIVDEHQHRIDKTLEKLNVCNLMDTFCQNQATKLTERQHIRIDSNEELESYECLDSINISNYDVDCEDNFESLRALERFKKMRTKLDKS